MEALKLLQNRPARTVYENIKGQEIIAPKSIKPIPFFITKCYSSTIDLSTSKAAQITIERSQDSKIKIGSTIGSVELISCQNIILEFSSAGTVIVDSTTEAQIQFQDVEQLEKSLVITTNCKMIEIIAGEESEIVQDSVSPSAEYKIQLKTTFKGEFKTETCNTYGDAI